MASKVAERTRHWGYPTAFSPGAGQAASTQGILDLFYSWRASGAETYADVGMAGLDYYKQLADLKRTVDEVLAKMEEISEQLEERPGMYNAQLFDLANPKYVLRYPLLVAVERYPDETVARLPDFDLYATGISDSVALAKLKAEIVSTFERLEELGVERLGPLALQWFHTMMTVIERVNG